MNSPSPAFRGTSEGVFGLSPEGQTRAAAVRQIDELTGLWVACHNVPPAGLAADLEQHKRIFDPVAQGKRLREALLAVDPTAQISLREPQVLSIDATRCLITPEGRIALELLLRAVEVSSSDRVTVDPALARRWEGILLSLYRDWGRHRLRSVIDLLGGGAKPLQIPAIGVALTLLVNRADRPDRAIRRLDPGTGRDVLDTVFRSCSEAFARELAPSTRRSTTKERISGGWTVGEITRRLPDAIHNSDEAGVYVENARRDDLLRLIVEELRRRSGVTLELVEDAFDSLVREFRRSAQALAGYGLLFERPGETDRLRETLVALWQANYDRR